MVLGVSIEDKYLKTGSTSQVVSSLGFGGLLLNMPFINLETTGWFPTVVLSFGRMMADIALHDVHRRIIGIAFPFSTKLGPFFNVRLVLLLGASSPGLEDDGSSLLEIPLCSKLCQRLCRPLGGVGVSEGEDLHCEIESGVCSIVEV